MTPLKRADLSRVHNSVLLTLVTDTDRLAITMTPAEAIGIAQALTDHAHRPTATTPAKARWK